MDYQFYDGSDWDKCRFCDKKYTGTTFMGMDYCEEHEELAEKRSMDAADYRAEMQACNE